MYKEEGLMEKTKKQRLLNDAHPKTKLGKRKIP